MQSRHKDRRQYFNEQTITTRDYVIPFIEEIKKLKPGDRILEVGCGEGGNLVPFIEMGMEVTGVDINTRQLERAVEYLSESGYKDVNIINQDIYKTSPTELGEYDVIFLRDVIEHIPNQERFMTYIKSFMKPDGIIFFGFPPWQMPFGGHQQVLRGWIGKTPYIHLLPRSVYVRMMKLNGVTERAIETRLEIVDTGISLERFERCIRRSELNILKKTHYLTNPNYKTKFNLSIWKVMPPFNMIPWLRNFYTTCGYYVVGK
jgi:SAM-dependent methyltransferase